MNLVKIAALPFRYRPWHFLHARLILKDLVAVADQPALDSKSHLQAAIDWLCHAQDMRSGWHDEGGVAAGWSFEDGWLPSYPETTGYIIETFIAAAELLDLPDLKARAQRMIDWELSIQNSDGSFPGHFGETGSRPVIFNTGQIMHGMVAGYVEFGRNECLDAAVKAGRWMVACQDEDGCWRRNEHNGIPHTYNTRATWALLRTGLISREARLVDGAKRNLDWALSQQTESGWFATNGAAGRRTLYPVREDGRIGIGQGATSGRLAGGDLCGWMEAVVILLLPDWRCTDVSELVATISRRRLFGIA